MCVQTPRTTLVRQGEHQTLRALNTSDLAVVFYGWKGWHSEHTVSASTRRGPCVRTTMFQVHRDKRTHRSNEIRQGNLGEGHLYRSFKPTGPCRPGQRLCGVLWVGAGRSLISNGLVQYRHSAMTESSLQPSCVTPIIIRVTLCSSVSSAVKVFGYWCRFICTGIWR